MANQIIDRKIETFLDGIIFQARKSFTVGNGLEAPVLLLKNPIANSQKIRSLIIQATTKEATTFIIRPYGNPTITTDGTVVNIKSNLLKTSPPNSVMSLFHSPSISNNGVQGKQLIISDKRPTDILDLSRSLIVFPGKDILITAEHTALTSQNVELFMDWIEI